MRNEITGKGELLNVECLKILTSKKYNKGIHIQTQWQKKQKMLLFQLSNQIEWCWLNLFLSGNH